MRQLEGLAEHFGYLDTTLNPDLDDIASTYGDSVFLVAWYGGKMIGTGALVRGSDGSAGIVRMSVAADFRRKGVGSVILRHLCDHAGAAGHGRVLLHTDETWTGAINFYKRCGFRVTHHSDGDVHLALNL